MCACARAAGLSVVVLCLPVLQVASLASDPPTVSGGSDTSLGSIEPNDLTSSNNALTIRAKTKISNGEALDFPGNLPEVGT